MAANGPKTGKEGGRSEYCARLAVQHVHPGDPHGGDDQVLHRNKGLQLLERQEEEPIKREENIGGQKKGLIMPLLIVRFNTTFIILYLLLFFANGGQTSTGI